MLSIRWLIPVSILSVLLAGCGDKKVEKEVQALKSESPEERASAALHLGKMGDKATKAAPELVKLLEDPEPKVRAAAAVALGGMKVQDEKVVAALVVATEESPPEVQTSAMMSLQALEADSDLVQVSIRMLNSASAEVRLNATLRLIELKKKAEPAIPALIQALSDPIPDVRVHAAYALRPFVDREDVKLALMAAAQAERDYKEAPDPEKLGVEKPIKMHEHRGESPREEMEKILKKGRK